MPRIVRKPAGDSVGAKELPLGQHSSSCFPSTVEQHSFRKACHVAVVGHIHQGFGRLLQCHAALATGPRTMSVIDNRRALQQNSGEFRFFACPSKIIPQGVTPLGNGTASDP